jgi:hypothetical protein
VGRGPPTRLMDGTGHGSRRHSNPGAATVVPRKQEAQPPGRSRITSQSCRAERGLPGVAPAWVLSQGYTTARFTRHRVVRTTSWPGGRPSRGPFGARCGGDTIVLSCLPGGPPGRRSGRPGPPWHLASVRTVRRNVPALGAVNGEPARCPMKLRSVDSPASSRKRNAASTRPRSDMGRSGRRPPVYRLRPPHHVRPSGVRGAVRPRRRQPRVGQVPPPPPVLRRVGAGADQVPVRTPLNWTTLQSGSPSRVRQLAGSFISNGLWGSRLVSASPGTGGRQPHRAWLTGMKPG